MDLGYSLISHLHDCANVFFYKFTGLTNQNFYKFIHIGMVWCMKMYENNYKNKTFTKFEELDRFLQLIADLDEEIKLFALGGTAMVLKGIKESTKDIDFLTTSDYNKVKKSFELAGLKEKSSSKLCNIWYLDDIRIDIFYDEFILGVSLKDDWEELSEKFKRIGKIDLFILNWYDTIITKLARSEPRDIEDILSIIKRMDIDFGRLRKRYYDLAEVSLIPDFDYKFKNLEKRLK